MTSGSCFHSASGGRRHRKDCIKEGEDCTVDTRHWTSREKPVNLWERRSNYKTWRTSSLTGELNISNIYVWIWMWHPRVDKSYLWNNYVEDCFLFIKSIYDILFSGTKWRQRRSLRHTQRRWLTGKNELLWFIVSLNPLSQFIHTSPEDIIYDTVLQLSPNNDWIHFYEDRDSFTHNDVH